MTKNLTLLILSLLFFQIANAQVQKDTSIYLDDAAFAAVHQEPSFPHGAAAFNAFLAHTVRFPAIDRQNGTVGKVIITFVVEKDGTLSNIKVLRSPTKTMGDASIDAIKNSPPWNPGMQDGQPVRVQYTISFAFSMANN